MQDALQLWKNLLQNFSHFPLPEIEQCARTVVYQQDNITLYRYTPVQKKLHATRF